ncbi:hypothetical protein [Halobaculum sp. MBLA0143]|uniref:hypothetical protein n=1 Tax=Halobaculum sp. MBLA0143 TaxID=3079933 RepID=UPI00352410CE
MTTPGTHAHGVSTTDGQRQTRARRPGGHGSVTVTVVAAVLAHVALAAVFYPVLVAVGVVGVVGGIAAVG